MTITIAPSTYVVGGDPQFRSIFDNYMQSFLPQLPKATDQGIQAAYKSVFGNSPMGSGSNPYAAAYQVSSALGKATGVDFTAKVPFDPSASETEANAAVNRSPEGQARAQDTSTWNNIRDNVEAGASVVGNYYFPGSGAFTSQMVSSGAQDDLHNQWGALAMAGSGVAGGVNGNFSNYGKAWDGVSSLGSGGAGTTTTGGGSMGDDLWDFGGSNVDWSGWGDPNGGVVPGFNENDPSTWGGGMQNSDYGAYNPGSYGNAQVDPNGNAIGTNYNINGSTGSGFDAFGNPNSFGGYAALAKNFLFGGENNGVSSRGVFGNGGSGGGGPGGYGPGGGGGYGLGGGGSGGSGSYLPALLGAILGATQGKPAPISSSVLTNTTSSANPYLDANMQFASSLPNSLALPGVPTPTPLAFGTTPTATPYKTAYTDDYINNAIRGAVAPMEDQFRETTMPAIRGSSLSNGQPASSRQSLSEAIAARELARATGEVSSGMQQNLSVAKANEAFQGWNADNANAFQRDAAETAKTAQAYGINNQNTWTGYNANLQQALQQALYPINKATAVGNIAAQAGGMNKSTNSVSNTQLPQTPQWQTALGGAIAANEASRKVFNWA